MVFPSLPSQPSFHLVLINLFANFHSGQLSCKLLFMTIFSKFCKLSFHIDYLQNLQISNPHKSIAYFADCCFGLFFFLQIVVLNNLFANCCFTHRFVNLRTVAPGNFFSSSNCDNIFATWPSVSFFCKF